MSDVIQQRLEEAFAASGLSQAALGRAANIDRGSISLYLSGRYKPKAEKLIRLAAALSVTPEWLCGIDHAPPAETVSSLPVFCGLDSEGRLRFTGETMPVPRSAAENGEHFILRLSGTAMYPRLVAGDCLLIQKTDEIPDNSVAVLIQDGNLLVRTVSGHMLLPANPEYPPRPLEPSAHILGHAVMAIRKL